MGTGYLLRPRISSWFTSGTWSRGDNFGVSAIEETSSRMFGSVIIQPTDGVRFHSEKTRTCVFGIRTLGACCASVTKVASAAPFRATLVSCWRGASEKISRVFTKLRAAIWFVDSRKHPMVFTPRHSPRMAVGLLPRTIPPGTAPFCGKCRAGPKSVVSPAIPEVSRSFDSRRTESVHCLRAETGWSAFGNSPTNDACRP